MTGTRWIMGVALCLTLTADAFAQFFPPVIGLPTIGQGGIAFRGGGKRLSYEGFIPIGPAYPAILPVTPTPFGFQQVAPAYLPFGYSYGPIAPGFPFPAYGAIEQRYTVTIINPPGLGARAGFNPVYDTAGIDLDVEPASKIWGNQAPGIAKAPAKRPDLAQADAKKPQVARAAAMDEAKAPALPALPKPVPPPDGDALSDLGIAAFRNGEYGVAMLRFRQAGDDPKPAPRAVFLQAQSAIAVGKYRDAVDLIHQGMKQQPDWPTSGFMPRIDLYAQQNAEWKAHLAALEETQARNPKDADYLFLLGYMAWFDGKRDAAVDYFTQSKALAAEPHWADAFLKAAK